MRVGTLFNAQDIEIVDSKQRIAMVGGVKKDLSETTKAISDRIKKLTNMIDLGREPFTVIHYEKGGKFVPHVDYFYDEIALAKSNDMGNRIGTVIMYLNTVETGGQTLFPKLKLALKPVKGDIVFFNYDRHQAKKSSITLHASNGVVDDKWISTLWMNLG